MEHESFEDENTAEILNRHFVAIKVDREERPDIDKHFQEVYQLMNGRPGGWPASIFLTEDLKPFYAATYIPPEPRYGMMSFPTLLEVIADKYKNEKEPLVEEAEKVLSHLKPDKDKIQATKLDDTSNRPDSSLTAERGASTKPLNSRRPPHSTCCLISTNSQAVKRRSRWLPFRF